MEIIIFIPVPVIWMRRKEVLKENLFNEPTEIGRNHESHVKKNVLPVQIKFSPVHMIFSPGGGDLCHAENKRKRK